MGKPIGELEAVIGKPFVVGPARPNAFGPAGAYGKARSYNQDWGVLEVLVENERISGMLFGFPGIGPRNSDEVLAQLGLTTGQKPNNVTATETTWNNLGGLTVKVVTEGGATGKIVFAVVYRAR